MSVVEVDGLGRRYGEVWALRDVSTVIEKGTTLGFIGPNGAGKSTFLNMLVGLLPPSEGSVRVLGCDPQLRVPANLGYVADDAPFPASLSAAKALAQIATVRGIADARSIRESLVRVGLDPNSRKPTRAFSHGMRQRLNIAQALMESPELLVLDEPTNGLDAEAILALRTLIGELNAAGTTVVLASHLLTEVERVCHRVLLVARGRVRKTLDLDALRGKTRVRFADDPSFERASGHPLFDSADRSERSVVFNTDDGAGLVADLVGRGAGVAAVLPGSSILEREFLGLIRGSSAAL